MARSYPDVYVAQCSMGASPVQAIKALTEAEQHKGPSLVIVYAPCMEHGIKASEGGMGSTSMSMKLAVDTGYWVNYRYNPDLIAQGKNPMAIDSAKPKRSPLDFLMTQTRFERLIREFPDRADLHRQLAVMLARKFRALERERDSWVPETPEDEDAAAAGFAPPTPEDQMITTPGSAVPESHSGLIVAFGSVSGNAQAAADQAAKKLGLASPAIGLDKLDRSAFEAAEDVVLVVSTNGDGDYPGNADAFAEWLGTRKASSLSHMKVRLLGLGSSDYEHYNQAAKNIKALLEAKGATVAISLANEAADGGIDAGVSAFLAQL
eukprot:gnl/Ergobibamus_cyprinoides/546.p1 GENE.gnl/Ergobibamus_cyprinoides/546~~gnl/Ergobibamus_cyprinoides/546.p1  ORF type:complete len:321 (+),score=119.17 gnl/Ergobibamus_cyprinoides/546:511-1473(+)